MIDVSHLVPIGKALRAPPERERAIVIRRYGLDGGTPATLRDVGDALALDIADVPMHLRAIVRADGQDLMIVPLGVG